MIPMSGVAAVPRVVGMSAVVLMSLMPTVMIMGYVIAVTDMPVVLVVTGVVVVPVMFGSVVVHRVATAVIVVATRCGVHTGLASPVRFESCLQCWGQVQLVGSISLSTTHLWLVMVMPSAS